MEQTHPLVSIVITSYNRARMIEKAIDSALAQDYPNFEVIISDNCSTDGTHELFKKYKADPRVKITINENNIGMIPNFIQATNELSSGEYITFISSDDYLINSSFVSEAMSRMLQYPNLSLVTSINTAYYEDSKKYAIDWSYFYYKDTFFNKPYVSGTEVFLSFPKCHAISYGGTLFHRKKLMSLDLSVKALSLDVQNVLQMVLLGDVSFIDKNTYVATRHSDNATGTGTAQTYIGNTPYIDVPYTFAKTHKLIDEALLEKWRDDMYYFFIKELMIYFYKKNRKEYHIFSAYFKKKHRKIYNKVVVSFSWITEYLLFAFVPVGTLYMKLRSKAATLNFSRRKNERELTTGLSTS